MALNVFKSSIVNKSSRTHLLLKQTRFVGTGKLLRVTSVIGKLALVLSSASSPSCFKLCGEYLSPHPPTPCVRTSLYSLDSLCLCTRKCKRSLPLFCFVKFLQNSYITIHPFHRAAFGNRSSVPTSPLEGVVGMLLP